MTRRSIGVVRMLMLSTGHRVPDESKDDRDGRHSRATIQDDEGDYSSDEEEFNQPHQGFLLRPYPAARCAKSSPSVISLVSDGTPSGHASTGGCLVLRHD